MATTRRSALPILLLTLLSLARPGRPAALAFDESLGDPAIRGVQIGLGNRYGQRDRDRGLSTVTLGTWTPVFVEVHGDRDYTGTLEVETPDDDGVPATVRLPIASGKHREQTFVVATRPGLGSGEVLVRLLDSQGQVLQTIREPLAERVLEPGTQLVAVAGTLAGFAELPALARYQRYGRKTPVVAVASVDQWPTDWFGFDAVETLVVEAGAPGLLAALEARDGRALKALGDWVAQGGHLVVVAGAAVKAEAGSEAAQVLARLKPLLPASPGERVTVERSSVESFVGNVAPLGQTALSAARLTALVPSAVPLAATPATPLIVRGPLALGRVTLVGLDLAGPPFSAWKDARLFWDKVLDLRGQAGESDVSRLGARGAIIQADDPALASQLHRVQETFPGVQSVQFGWVAAAVLGYILLIGPLDYLFLRKVVKRMELTWITFPLIVATVSGLGLWGAQKLKGRELRVNQVDAVDLDPAAGRLRGSSWVTVFSPGNRDFTVSQTPLRADLKPAASGAKPDADGRTLSWFGPPVPVLGGSARLGFGATGYTATGTDGHPESLQGVRIPIWSTRSFSGRWTGPSDGAVVLDSDLRPVGGDRISGSVRNRLDRPMKNVQVYYGRNVYMLGDIRPGAVGRVDPTRTESMSRFLGRLAQNFGRSKDGADPGDLIRVAMFHDALGPRGEEHPNLGLHSLDLSDQANELRRPMIVAEIEAPAAELSLGDGVKPDVLSQRTVLRVVLPTPTSGPASTATAATTPAAAGSPKP